MAKTAIIITYFGKWPEWSPLFFHSCGKNPIVDFIFFTDCGLPQTPPLNCKFINISYLKYCKLVSDRLGIEFMPERAYKLCDLKPFYGFIHAEELLGYDYFGYGDIDLVYGNLQQWLEPFYAGKKDVFSTHSNCVSGHFCLIRNVGRYTLKGFQIKGWKKKLLSLENKVLDEGAYSHKIMPRIRFIRYVLDHFFGIKEFYKRQSILEKYSCIFLKHIDAKELCTSPWPAFTDYWTYDCESGIVVDKEGRNLPYLHYLFFKQTEYWKENFDYWKEGFYQLPKPINDDMKIRIDKCRISLII